MRKSTGAGARTSTESPDPLPTPVPDATAARDERILGLDGLRGIAVIMVMAYHFMAPIGLSTSFETAVLSVVRVGWIGVELFFVLSGFLITGILWEAQKRFKGTAHLPTFYARRVLRIFPLYYAVIAIVIIVGLLVPSLPTDRLIDDQAWLWLYGVNVGHSLHHYGYFYLDWIDFTHFWTLAVEEAFYLAWPWLLLWRNPNGIIVACGVLLIVSIGLRAWGEAGASGWGYALTASPREAGSLIIGSALALIMYHESGARRMARIAPVLMIGCFVVCVVAMNIDTPQSEWVRAVFGPAFIGLGFAGLLTYIVRGTRGVTQRFFESKTLRFFGKYSYGLYVFHHLFHPLWLALLDEVHEATGVYRLAVLVMVVVATLSSIGLSLLSWRLLERPLLKFKKYFEYSRPADGSPDPAHTHDKPRV